MEAKKCKTNENGWKEHLNWVNWGDQTPHTFERVAWIRIVGLPLHMWGEGNFAAITQGFGKTIAPFNTIPARVDLSCTKIGILTERKTRINEEMQVVFGGKTLSIGITEFDEDWWPFRFDPSKDFYEEELESGEEDDDGMSDTWIDEECEDREEGEIRDEDELPSEPMTVEETVMNTRGNDETGTENTQTAALETDTNPVRPSPESEKPSGENRETQTSRSMQAAPPMKEGETTPRDVNLTGDTTNGNIPWPRNPIPTEYTTQTPLLPPSTSFNMDILSGLPIGDHIAQSDPNQASPSTRLTRCLVLRMKQATPPQKFQYPQSPPPPPPSSPRHSETTGSSVSLHLNRDTSISSTHIEHEQGDCCSTTF
ncbi:hypothetical protein LXL04_015061 [Taraxacum kok-saghyz]